LRNFKIHYCVVTIFGKELGKMERVNKNGCNEAHQPSKSQEAAACAETI
jgi:hypothetical protein